jgi:GAF domain-containing protein
LTGIAVDTVPACDLGSITTVDERGPHTSAFTDVEAVLLDEAQYRHGDGPCLAAIRHHGVEQVDARTDTRWPPFNETACALDVLGCLSVPLIAGEAAVGGLNLYSKAVAQFDDDSRQTATLFADQLGVAAARAALLTDAATMVEHLRRAMESRAVIEQAKGIIIAAQRCTPEQAFTILVRASQNRNRKLRDIAADIVAHHVDDPSRHA